jgi:choline dehydrogenase
MGIKSRVNLPDVGKNLSVHISAGFSFFANSTDTYDDIIRNQTYRQILLDEWNATNGGGLLGWNFGTFASYVRLPSNSTVFELHPDPASGPDSPHLGAGASVSKSFVLHTLFLIFAALKNGNLNPPAEGHFIGGGATLVTPTSSMHPTVSDYPQDDCLTPKSLQEDPFSSTLQIHSINHSSTSAV